jgi:hypothetical protein
MPRYRKGEAEAARRRVLLGMSDYLAEFPNCGYTHDAIDRCREILDTCLAALNSEPRPSPSQVRSAVKRAVLALNKLNKCYGGSLIETDQREDLCAVLLGAAQAAGLGTEDDITEAWRQW